MFFVTENSYSDYESRSILGISYLTSGQCVLNLCKINFSRMNRTGNFCLNEICNR